MQLQWPGKGECEVGAASVSKMTVLLATCRAITLKAEAMLALSPPLDIHTSAAVSSYSSHLPLSRRLDLVPSIQPITTNSAFLALKGMSRNSTKLVIDGAQQMTLCKVRYLSPNTLLLR